MSEFLVILYDLALVALQWIGGEVGVMGLGYYIANIAVFVLIQPSLILIFMGLWLRQKQKNRRLVRKRNLLSGNRDV
tara:strand:- start:357 stop:587 length:231 start_codon:yes stop_codon:yes gene_type:complete